MRTAAALAALTLLAACSDPKDVEGWARRAATRNRLDEKLEALEKARAAPGDRKAAVPHLVAVLGQAPRARAEAALILGEIGDPAAVKPLLAAIDAGDRPERDAADANRQIATALGRLGSAEAVPVLSGLVAARDPFTRVAAVDALGAIGDPAAVPVLLGVVEDPAAQPFLVKKALLALGVLADARAVPAAIHLLYVVRDGASFFPEAAFALSLIGAPASAPLAAAVRGEDPALLAWARERPIHPAALRAKAAQVLGDVGGAGAVPALVAALGYADAEPGAQLLVRVFAAESLGRLRAREAVAPVAALLARERDPDARDRYADALARIGDPAALPALRAAAASGGTVAEREGLLAALARLGGPGDGATVRRAREACGAACPAATAAAFDGMAAALQAAGECGEALTCWAGKLGDDRAAVRDRAALEVGRRGGAAEAAALTAALARPVEADADLAARYHAVLALDWIARRAPLGAAGAEVVAAVDRVLAADKGRTLTAVVNEDAFRLASRLKRAR